ncbi:ABC transporter permease [Clostridium swellfunianum]|uniref:ABC transporter permease n=1 Tax=Clostridium swellfunianum TaxID=1367462 RepID=UPI00202EBA32|nr:ABC transporter permease [Clostridium swellfunianum]MCM0648395.1 ABC transporter permease [Clostridium swellfunianum]
MRKNKFLIPLLAVLLGFITGAIVMLVTGHNPLQAYTALLKGAGFFGSIKRFGDTLLNTTTLILTGLSVAFAFRTGLFNIGAPGQMLMGGFAASFIGVRMNLPAYIHMPLAVAAAILFGALWAFLPGFLKSKFKIHEVVTSIMMNYIAMWSVYYFVPVLMPGQFNTESKPILPSASLRVPWLTKLFEGSYVNLGLFMALICVILVWWILEKTTFGYELKAVGFNVNASQYAGMKVNRNMILSMMIAGALAGLAGATYYIGYADNIKIGMLPSQGYDGIAVALLGLNNPFGVALAALLFGFMNAGRLFMQSSTSVPNELVPIIIAIIIFFAATSLMLEGWVKRFEKLFRRNAGDK